MHRAIPKAAMVAALCDTEPPYQIGFSRKMVPQLLRARSVR